MLSDIGDEATSPNFNKTSTQKTSQPAKIRYSIFYFVPFDSKHYLIVMNKRINFNFRV